MSKNGRVRRQLVINMVLMLFTLMTLVACVTAWFSTRTEADINNLNLTVNRAELKIEPDLTTIEFPCATKITDTTATFFNKDCLVLKRYTVDGEGEVHVDVECSGDGMLAYVPDNHTTNYYEALVAELKDYFRSDDISLKSFDEIKTALDTINNKRVGVFKNQNTVFEVVYWVEYDPVTDENGNNLNSDSYWLDTTYKAKITVTG